MSYESSIHTNHDTESHYSTRASLLDRAQEFIEDHQKATSIVLLGAVATGALISFNSLRGGTNDPSRFEHNPAVTSVTLEEDARVRYDPNVENTEGGNLIDVVDQAITVPTVNGVYTHVEFRNGKWIGVDPASIPNFDSKGDKDNIVWINEGKISTTTAESE